VHEILDDWESALCYTAHSSQDNVGLQMELYDEVDVHRDGGVEGGRLKRDVIHYGLKVIFHPSLLHNLIEDLCSLFDLCYPLLSVTSHDDIYGLWKARNA